MIPLLKNFPALAVASIALAKSAHATVDAARAWLVGKGFDSDVELEDQAGQWFAQLRPADSFVADSEREILTDGALIRVGLDAAAVQKGAINPLPTFAPEQLRNLGALDIRETTLTENPILDVMAAIRVVKAAGEPEGEPIQKAAPFVEIESDQRIVGGYVLVPNVPDHQGDIVPASEVEPAAHSLLSNIAKGRALGGGVGLEHQDWDGVGCIVSSFVDHAGVHGIPGGWYVETLVERDDVWERVEKGMRGEPGGLRGYSIGGGAGRREVIEDLFTVLKGQHPVEKAMQTLDEMRDAVGRAIRAAHVDEWAWIEALYTDRVVYHRAGGLWLATYTINDEGAAELGEPTEVRVEYVEKAWRGGAPKPPQKEPEMTPEEVKKAVADGIQEGLAQAQASPPATTAEAPADPPAPAAPAEEGDTTERVLKSLESVDSKLGRLLEQTEKHGEAIDQHAELINRMADKSVRKGGGVPVAGAATVGGKGDDDLDWGHPRLGVHHHRQNSNGQ